MRNNQVVLVKSSIKDKNHFAPKMLRILDGPQIDVSKKKAQKTLCYLLEMTHDDVWQFDEYQNESYSNQQTSLNREV